MIEARQAKPLWRSIIELSGPLDGRLAPRPLPRAFCMWLKTLKFSYLEGFGLTFEGESSQNWWYLHGCNTPLACSTGKNLAVRVLRAVRVIGISAFGGETDACRSIYPLPILALRCRSEKSFRWSALEGQAVAELTLSVCVLLTPSGHSGEWSLQAVVPGEWR